jgi:hypothetical protein
VAAIADPRPRDYSKPDFFNGIGQNRKLPTTDMSFRSAPKDPMGVWLATGTREE